MKKILIADDHVVVRRGIREILAEEDDLQVAGEVSHGDELIKTLSESVYDLLILDISMPGVSGLENLKEVKRLFPALPVLILTMHPEDEFAVRFLKAGASGYLVKDCAPEGLVTAIRDILSGKKYVSPILAQRLVVAIHQDDNLPPHQKLSDREYQVFQLISSGLGLSEIAKKLTLSVKTVSTYRARILEKMAMKSNADLTRYAIHSHLVL